MSGSEGEGARVEALVRELSLLPEAERPARLAALRGESETLAREVAAQLASTLATVGMFDTPSDPSRSLPPPRLGAWRLVEPLGEGGMGEVWLAERTEGGFAQQAALKLVRAAVAREHALARFRLERQVLARLNHPAIAKILDGGVAPDGRPWFAMERVSGLAITDFVRERGLPLEARLRLLIAVCEAVDFAHRNLIVHRDLKPSNILVTEGGEPRLLDFGLAKLLESEDDPGLTRTHMLAFTPAYAAPEQVLGGAITTATDVYALGVLLYEMLTSRLPHERGGRPPAALAEAVSHETVTRPSLALRRDLSRGSSHDARRLEGDVDTIALKALHREPERRYQSASALADDLRRFLEGRPISARPDTLGYRARRFAGRHRVGVALSSLTALSLVAGLGTALVQRDRARREAERAQAEAARAERIKSFALGLLAQANPVANERGREMSAASLLHQAASQIEKGLEDEPAARTEMRVMVAQGLVSLGETREALALLDRSIAEMRARPGSPVALAGALHEAGKARFGSSDLDGARAATEEALALLQDAAGADAAQSRIGLRTTLLRIANIQGRHADAIEIGTRNLEDRRRLLGADSPALAVDWNNLAASQLACDRFADAEKGFREAARLLARDPKSPESRQAWLKNGLGSALWNLGRTEEGRRELAEAHAIAVRTLGPEHELAGLALLNLGATTRREGRAAEALARVEAARAIYVKLNHPQIARVELERGLALLALARDADAERVLAALLDEFAKRPQDRSEVRYRALGALGLARARLGRAVDGARLAREGLAGLEEGSDDFAYVAAHLAEILERQGAQEEARMWRERSQAVLRKLLGPDHPAIRAGAP